MKRRNYTREILAEIKRGSVPVATVLGCRVQYAPRRKTDPAPWTDGFYRYSGREVHTVPPCPMGFLNGAFCGLPMDHDRTLIHRILPAIRNGGN